MPDALPGGTKVEQRFQELCARHGLPTGRTRVLIEGYEVDFYWPEAKVVVETDGRAVHNTRRAFHADRRRDRALAASAIEVVRVTWPDLDEPVALARQLAAILARRSRGAGC